VLDVAAATGEVFNLGGVAPFSTAELVKYIGANLDLPYVTAQVPNLTTPWYISSDKARELLAYAPRYSVFDMVDEAITTVAGKSLPQKNVGRHVD
jgi:UDP-glucose 4-epimerase